jgi:hypothetical protein
MESTYGVNRRHIEKFRQDRWGSTSREELQILMSLADTQGFAFLTLEEDQLWATFKGTRGVTFVSRRTTGVRSEDLEAMKFLLDEGIHLDPPEAGEISAKVRSRNVVSFGSPKNNRDCDEALRLFFPDAADAGPAPFQFVWTDWNPSDKTSPFGAQAAGIADVGLRVAVPPTAKTGAAKRHQRDAGKARATVLLRADLAAFSDQDYGWDFGILVMCRQPLKTSANVTTVLIGGLSGFSTQEVARDLSQGLLFLHPKHIVPGRPLWRILCCPWKKEGTHPVRHSRGRRWLDPTDAKAVGKMAADSLRPPPGRLIDEEIDDEAHLR